MDRSDFECFLIILEPSFDKLNLPKKFARWLEGREPREMKLREADAGRNSFFNVEVVREGHDVVYLRGGWKLFASSYSLDTGYFLLLSYDGVDMLSVKVFNLSMCRKYYQHETGVMDRSDFECFLIILEPSFDKLNLPKKFARWLEGREPREMKLREADAGRNSFFNVEVVREGHDVVYLRGGWKLFASSYSLDTGYFLLLSYDGVDMLSVKVFNLSMCRKYYQHDNSDPVTVLDQLCVIPKGVSLDGRQEAIVKDCCAQNEPKIPFYVCRIVQSHIDEAKGKMYFNQEYTRTHLSCLLTKAGTIDVEIYDNTNEKIGDFSMKVGVNEKATITHKWLSVTKSQKWKVGDIVMFWFRRHGDRSLRLDVKKI